MASVNNLQTRYSQELLALLDQMTYTVGNGIIVNRNYDPQNIKGGAVTIYKPTAVEVKGYKTAEAAGVTQMGDAQITITNFLQPYVAIPVDMYEDGALPYSKMAAALMMGAKALAKALDRENHRALVEEGTVSSVTTAITKANAYEMILNENRALTEAGVATEGRAIVASPAMIALLKQDTNFVLASEIMASQVKMAGFVGRVDGLNVIESNLLGKNLAAVAGVHTALDLTKVMFVIGHADYTTQVAEFSYTAVERN